MLLITVLSLCKLLGELPVKKKNSPRIMDIQDLINEIDIITYIAVSILKVCFAGVLAFMCGCMPHEQGKGACKEKSI